MASFEPAQHEIDREFVLFDSLPPRLRRRLNEAPIKVSALDIVAALERGVSEDRVDELVRGHLQSMSRAVTREAYGDDHPIFEGGL